MTGLQRNPRRSNPEKAEMRKGRKLMEALGFATWNLAQARATNQTPGWPDCLFTHPDKRLAVWWEAKAPAGKQSPAQKEFQRHVTMCGYPYIAGTADAMIEWARAQGLIR